MRRIRSDILLRSIQGLGPLISPSPKAVRPLVLCALLALPTILIGPALRPGNALLPADLLVQFEPWRSHVSPTPRAHWDPLVWDGIAQYYPWRLFAAESFRASVLPLWNPYQFCGTPFLANGQSAVLYPLNLLFWLLPVARAFGWSAWLHLVLTGWFAYLFLRRLGAGRFGSISGALVWQANGFFVAWIHLPTVLCTAAWLPLILLCCERALRAGRARRALGAGAALGISYLGGHPQIFLFIALLTGVYLIFRGLSRRPGLSFAKRARRLLLIGAVTALTAAGLSSAQLLPTLALLRIAHRTFTLSPEAYTAFLSHSMPPLQLAGLLLPHAFGHPALGTYVGRDNYAEFAAYAGIAALGLALWGAIASRNWHARFFGIALLLTALVALGTPVNLPLYHWVPGLARAGGPARILLLVVFSLSILAGLGADHITRRMAQARTSALAPLLLLLAALGVGGWIWWWYGAPAVADIQPGVAPLSRVETIRAILLVIAAIASLALARRLSFRRASQVALLVILAADLALAARGHLHVAPLDWAYPSLTIDGSAGGRIVGNAADWPIDRVPRAVFPPNAATVYHLRDVFGYDSLYLARYRDFAAAVQHGDPSPALNGNLLLARLAPVYGLDMMSLAGVETVLSPVPLRGLRMERAGSFYTYRNPYARSRAWVAESALFVPGHIDAVVSLARLGPLEDCLIITGPDQPAEQLSSGIRPTAIIRDLSPNAVRVDLSGGGGYLFLADSYAPGWRAYAEGRELPIRAADVAFRAVALPRDAESVVFRYEPADFRVGLFIALVSAACIGAVCGRAVVMRDR